MQTSVNVWKSKSVKVWWTARQVSKCESVKVLDCLPDKCGSVKEWKFDWSLTTKTSGKVWKFLKKWLTNDRSPSRRRQGLQWWQIRRNVESEVEWLTCTWLYAHVHDCMYTITHWHIDTCLIDSVFWWLAHISDWFRLGIWTFGVFQSW